MNETFCPLLFQHLATHPHGGVTHCCIADHRNALSSSRDDDRYYNLNRDTVYDTMNSKSFRKARLEVIKGHKPKACLRCYDEEAKGADKGLLQRWSITDYEENIEQAGDNLETLFLQAVREVIEDQTHTGIDIPTDGEVRRENYIYYQCRQIDGIYFKTVTHKSVRDGAFEADLPTIVTVSYTHLTLPTKA